MKQWWTLGVVSHTNRSLKVLPAAATSSKEIWLVRFERDRQGSSKALPFPMYSDQSHRFRKRFICQSSTENFPKFYFLLLRLILWQKHVVPLSIGNSHFKSSGALWVWFKPDLWPSGIPKLNIWMVYRIEKTVHWQHISFGILIKAEANGRQTAKNSRTHNSQRDTNT